MKIIKKIKNHFHGSFWIAATILSKAIAQVIVLKSVATFFGASGVGYLGQALGCISIMMNIFSSGLINFIIIELTKYSTQNENIKNLYRLISFWCMSSFLILTTTAFLFSVKFSELAFKDGKESLFFIFLAIGSVFFNLSSITQGFFSAQKNVKQLFYFSFLANLLGLILFIAVMSLGEKNIPTAALLFYFSQGIIGICLLFRADENFKWLFIPKYNSKLLVKLLKFTSVVAITGALGALQQIYVRNYIISNLGLSWSDVGHWQALLKISEINLSFVGMTLMSLYLPSISAASKSIEVRQIASNYLKRVFFLVLLGSILVVTFSDKILQIIYSKEFVFLDSLLKIQFLGDIFKLCSWVFTYFILSKLRLELFLIIEIAGLLILTFTSILFSKYLLISGLVYAQAFTSILFFILTYFIYSYFSKKDNLWLHK